MHGDEAKLDLEKPVAAACNLQSLSDCSLPVRLQGVEQCGHIQHGSYGKVGCLLGGDMLKKYNKKALVFRRVPIPVIA